MRTFCKNCLMKCWEDDPTGLFSEDGFGEDCAYYIDNLNGKCLGHLLDEDNG